MLYTMTEVCKEANLSYQTLKYYCNEGLVPNVKRDKNNRRVFDEHDLKWVKDLICLKKCNMSIEEMKVYLALCLQGQLTIPQRQKILDQKRGELESEIKRLEASIDYIGWKQGFYNDVLSGKRQYISNLIKVEK